MQEQYSLLKQQNYQLKNQMSQLKNAFDLNRDILKIISEESKCSQPRVQMLYQIINRLTSINNQIMINTAQLIHQKNTFKFQVIFVVNWQKQLVKSQNQSLKQRIDELLAQQQFMNKTNKATELSIYFKNKINQIENQMKFLQQDRIIKEHQIDFLKKTLQVSFPNIKNYEGEQAKMSRIRQNDKNSAMNRFIEPPLSSLVPPLQHFRKYQTNKQTKLQIKLSILHREVSRLKIYSEELQYRLLVLLKVLQIQEDVQTKRLQNIRMKHRTSLEEQYSVQLAEVRLIRFALNNLVKEQKEGCDLLFSLTNRNLKKTNRRTIRDSFKCRRFYEYKSLQKYDKIRMRPAFSIKQKEQALQKTGIQQ